MKENANDPERWLAQWRSGQVEGLARLLEHLKRKGLAAYAARQAKKLDGRLGITGQDLIQEVYLRFLDRKIQEINDVDHFEAIVKTIIRNASFDLYPTARRETGLTENHDHIPTGPGIAPHSPTEGIFERARREERTWKRAKIDPRRDEKKVSTLARQEAKTRIRTALADCLDKLVFYPLGTPKASTRHAARIDEVVNEISWTRVAPTTRNEDLVMDYIHQLWDLFGRAPRDEDRLDLKEGTYTLANLELEACLTEDLFLGTIMERFHEYLVEWQLDLRILKVFKLHSLAGYTHPEVATILDITVDQAKKLQQEAKHCLQIVLEKLG